MSKKEEISRGGYIKQLCFSTVLQMFAQEKVLTPFNADILFKHHQKTILDYDATNIARILYSF